MTNPKAERLAEETYNYFVPARDGLRSASNSCWRQERLAFLAGWSACAKEQGELLGCLEETLEIVWAGHTEQVGKMLCKHALDRLRAHRLGEEGKT